MVQRRDRRSIEQVKAQAAIEGAWLDWRQQILDAEEQVKREVENRTSAARYKVALAVRQGKDEYALTNAWLGEAIHSKNWNTLQEWLSMTEAQEADPLRIKLPDEPSEPVYEWDQESQTLHVEWDGYDVDTSVLGTSEEIVNAWSGLSGVADFEASIWSKGDAIGEVRLDLVDGQDGGTVGPLGNLHQAWSVKSPGRALIEKLFRDNDWEVG